MKEARRIRRRYASKEALAGAEKRIERIALDITEHFKTHIRPNGFKAQVVAPSREAAVAYARKLQDFQVDAYPIITTSNDDPALFDEARQLPQKEIIGRFWIIDVQDLDEALTMAKEWPASSIVEVRPVMEWAG